MEHSNTLVSIADLVLEDRRQGVAFRNQPIPDERDAYRVQDLVCRDLSRQGGAPIGYKIGLTNPASQHALAASGPVWGRIFSGNLHIAPCSLDLRGLQSPVVEIELCLRVGALPDGPVPGAPPPVEAAFIALEVVDTRRAGPDADVRSMIADNSWGRAVILGVEADAGFFATPRMVRLFRDESLAFQSDSSVVMGSPLEALYWLSQKLAEQGRPPLQSGDLVMTGAIVNLGEVRDGLHYRAEIEGFAPFDIRVSDGHLTAWR